MFSKKYLILVALVLVVVASTKAGKKNRKVREL